MSAKNRATGDTEDEFQAALVTYTKAGNKTAAMRRLWNTAYEMGKSAGDDAVFEGRAAKDEPVGEKKRKIEGSEADGAGERDALSMDAFDVSFGSGKMAGMVMGMELGCEAEKQRWKDGGHFEDGTCRTFAGAVIVDSSSPPQSLPLDDAAGTFRFTRNSIGPTTRNPCLSIPSSSHHSLATFPIYVQAHKTHSTRCNGDTHGTTERRRGGDEHDNRGCIPQSPTVISRFPPRVRFLVRPTHWHPNRTGWVLERLPPSFASFTVV
ncbi:hypothetical protein B0H14DRAFT_3491148 [Mycena olivaceomarginata]|nr:hypothetical protein B0H14DRAFT_3491148 [Mycena olivaceomarginata]